MSDDSTAESQHKCDDCGATEGDLRPVMLVDHEEPWLLCNDCHDFLYEVELIDFERDAEVFGYA